MSDPAREYANDAIPRTHSFVAFVGWSVRELVELAFRAGQEAEREACAALCEQQADTCHTPGCPTSTYEVLLHGVAKTIRGRANPPEGE